MIPSTRAIVGTSSPRSPCNARNAASIAYATDETGSPITANANATSRIRRLLKIEPTAGAGIRRRAFTGSPPADQTSRHAFRVCPVLYDVEPGGRVPAPARHDVLATSSTTARADG